MKTLLKNLVAVTFFLFCVSSSFAQSLVVNSTANTSCGAPNGTASASVDGGTSDYTFRWYQGPDITGTLLAEQPAIVGLQSGVYTVTATHTSTAAVLGPVSVTVFDNVTYPVVSVELLSPKTNCVSPDGSLRAVPDGPAGDYSYAWYYGSSLPLGQGGQTATGLQHGIHTVRVTHNLTQCQIIASAQVPDESVFPSVSINVLSHLTSCTTPNGSVQAVPGGAAADYTYAWYQGPVTQGAVLSTSQTLSQLPAGAYTVQATHKAATQCTATATVNIQDNRPVFSASVQVLAHATSCTSPDGSLRAVPSTGAVSDYWYRWYAGTTPQGTVISTSRTLSNRAPGVYTVVIRHKVSLCETVVSGTIQDQTPVGGITVQVLAPYASCATPDGALTVVPQGPAGNYSYAWYEGTVAAGPVLSGGQVLDQLFAGTYTVVVTHTATQCQATLSAMVPDERVIPALSVNILSNETSCTSPNGSLVAVVQGLPEDYTYSWFAGATTTGPVLSTDETISGLSAGTYTVAALNNVSQCESQISAVIQDEKTVVQVSVTVASEQTSCGPPNGSLQAVVDGPYYDYTFEWYEGTQVSGPVYYMGPVITGLPAGIYTVRATHNSSQCQAVVSAMVQEQIMYPAAYVEVISNNTSCTEPDGALQAVVLTGAVGDHTYEWYAGFPYTGPILSTSNQVANLSAGTYTVVIRHKTTFCEVWASQDILDECQQGLMSAAGTDTGEEKLSYYPNPTTGTLWIRKESSAGYVALSDRNGNVILREKLSPSAEPFAVDLSGQPAGHYILTFTTAVGTSSYHISKH